MIEKQIGIRYNKKNKGERKKQNGRKEKNTNNQN